MTTKNQQIKSRRRVADHGEVFTNEREVNAMLDLVKAETVRLDSRFLEPACGSGNFLLAILRRKLAVVTARYQKSQSEWERYAVLAVSSLYGVDLLADNVADCRERLQQVFATTYAENFPHPTNDKIPQTIAFILQKNIVVGDALTMCKNDGTPIIFAEWSAVNERMIKRRDFSFRNLLDSAQMNNSPLFGDSEKPLSIPEAVREYPLQHFAELSDVE